MCIVVGFLCQGCNWISRRPQQRTLVLQLIASPTRLIWKGQWMLLVDEAWAEDDSGQASGKRRLQALRQSGKVKHTNPDQSAAIWQFNRHVDIFGSVKCRGFTETLAQRTLRSVCHIVVQQHDHHHHLLQKSSSMKKHTMSTIQSFGSNHRISLWRLSPLEDDREMKVISPHVGLIGSGPRVCSVVVEPLQSLAVCSAQRNVRYHVSLGAARLLQSCCSQVSHQPPHGCCWESAASPQRVSDGDYGGETFLCGPR
ncbi:hypothetical protein Q8A73_021749 [Channa argus]|nr:hypothetical protein Q8A73_021749 [Channa argus]